MSIDVDFPDLAADDEITAVDGHKLDATRTVEGTRRADGGLRLVRPGPASSPIEWWIYPSTGDTFTVRREPEPAAPALNVDAAPPLNRLAVKIRAEYRA